MADLHTKRLLECALRKMQSVCTEPLTAALDRQGAHEQMAGMYAVAVRAVETFANPSLTKALEQLEPLTHHLDLAPDRGEALQGLIAKLEACLAQVSSSSPQELYGLKAGPASVEVATTWPLHSWS